MRLTSVWYVDALILVSAIVFLLVKYISRNHDYWKKRGVFCVEPTPLFGNFYDIARFKSSIGEFLAGLYRRTDEPVFGMYVFGTPHLVLRSPDLVKLVMVKDFNHFPDRTIFAGEHDLMARSMIFINKNPEWRATRTKLTPVFSPAKLRGLVPHVNDIAADMLSHLEALAKANDAEGLVEMKEVCAKFTTAVIARLVFGVRAHCFEDDACPFRATGRMIFGFNLANAVQQTSAFFLPTLARLFRMRVFDKRVYQFLRQVTWQVLDQHELTKSKGDDLLHLINELRKNDDFCETWAFDGDKVVAQGGQFFAAGFESTSSTIGYALYELCIQPQLQDRLRKEIQQTLERDGEFTYDNVQQMTYLNMVVSETLRKYPALPFLDRRCNADYKLPLGAGRELLVERGTPVYIPMFGLHYDPRYFPDPQRFDPERFSEERIGDIVPFTYLPFGEGQRNCIGMRFGMMTAKMGLAHILKEFKVERAKETPVPLEFEPKTFVLASKFGLPMKALRI